MADNKTSTATATAEKPAVQTVEADEKFTIDTKELSRILTVVRYRLNEAIRDANRKAPILSNSQAEARAKANSLVKVLKEFSEQTF